MITVCPKNLPHYVISVSIFVQTEKNIYFMCDVIAQYIFLRLPLFCYL